MCGSTRNVARVARPFPSTIKLSITKQERGKGLAGQTMYKFTPIMDEFKLKCILDVCIHIQQRSLYASLDTFLLKVYNN